MKPTNDRSSLSCLLLSDANLQNFAGYLANTPGLPELKPVQAPFGQVEQILLDPDHVCWREKPDAAVIWTRPQTVIPTFNALLEYGQGALAELLRQVDAYAAMLSGIGKRVRYVLVPSWVLPPHRRIFGVLDMQTGTGLTNALMRMNLRLVERLEACANIFVLDAQKWVAQVGRNAVHPKLWYLGKIEYSNALFKEATLDVKAALNGALGQARKLVLLDLDDTLWGGIVGDLGWERLALGGHHPIGEAFADFQRALKSMKNRGIVLGIVSKNEERIAMEAIRRHPEMVLRAEDFAAWRINWQDKAQNIIDLLAELNLGPQSAVFIDDNPAERARVTESLPEVLVPDWPDDPLLYPSTLLSLRCFDVPSLSREDADRTRMYLSEAKRRELKKTAGSVEEWLDRLSIRVRIDPLGDENLQRAAQLLNKTNQMNLSTRRMSETELMAWARETHHHLWTIRVSDRFGDAGLTGIVSTVTRGRSALLIDFILSCRVMGRRIEDVMLAAAIGCARDLGLEAVCAEYRPTPKNKPCLDYFQSLTPPFKRQGQRFTLKTDRDVAMPRHIEVVHEGGCE